MFLCLFSKAPQACDALAKLVKAKMPKVTLSGLKDDFGSIEDGMDEVLKVTVKRIMPGRSLGLFQK